jgi:hypothetical protein
MRGSITRYRLRNSPDSDGNIACQDMYLTSIGDIHLKSSIPGQSSILCVTGRYPRPTKNLAGQKVSLKLSLLFCNLRLGTIGGYRSEANCGFAYFLIPIAPVFCRGEICYYWRPQLGWWSRIGLGRYHSHPITRAIFHVRVVTLWVLTKVPIRRLLF